MKRKSVLFLVIVMLMLLLAACNNDKDDSAQNVEKDNDRNNEEKSEPNSNNENNDKDESFNTTGFPIVEEPITLNFLAGKVATNANDYNETLIWKTYEDMTNIKIDWDLIQKESLTEKRNLSLASSKLPDVYYTGHMPNSDLAKYGEQGIFIELNDLIEQFMPNLTELLEQYPEIKKAIKFPDGGIYGLPTIYDPDFPSLLIGSKFWIREDWLEQLDMDMPETTEAFYEYLKAVKETDLNENGKDDEIPFGAASLGDFKKWLLGSFGLANRGRNHNYIDIDPKTDEMRFFPTTEPYKEFLQYINKLYSEGLILENIFTVETSTSNSFGEEGLYGSSINTSAEAAFGEEGKNYVGMPALEGPNGDKMLTKIGFPVAHMGGFVVTNENENVPETLRWMDYFYGDEGATLFFMGIEDETYEINEDEEIEYVDAIRNSEEGLTLNQELSKYFTWLGGGYPGIVKEEIFNGSEALPTSIEAGEQLKDDMIDEVWPQFTYTKEENRKLAPLQSDIHKYVDEMSDKFISGDISFSEWDDYVDTIKGMDLEDYMSIQNNAYERYQSN